MDEKIIEKLSELGFVKAIAAQGKPVINLDTGQIFKSGVAASLNLGYAKSTVGTALYCGKSCGGFRWAYYNGHG